MKPYIVRTKALLIVIVTAFLFICIVVSACSPIRTKVDLVDKRNNINYSSYRSYDIVPNEQLDLVGLPLDKANLDELITRTVHKQLQGNGFQRNKENPDFLVAYYIVTNTKTDVYYIDNYYSGAGYMPNRSSTRNSNLLMETTYEQGILIIDVIDNTSKERIWSAHSESRLGVYKKSERIQSHVEKAVRKTLSRFPPEI